jgi:hypothetical protein
MGLHGDKSITAEGESAVSDEQAQQADDPSGPGWRDVSSGEILHVDDMVERDNGWGRTRAAGTPAGYQRYRRRIEPPQPSDSEPETMEDLRRRLAECEVLLAEAEISGEQVNARLQQLREQARDLTRQTQVDALELQQLREQVQTLTQERNRLQSWLQQHHTTGQQSAVKKLERWLKPVLKVVSDHPDHTSILAASVLEFLPQIASRLIEE